MQHFARLDASTTMLETSQPDSEKILSGQPEFKTWNQVETAAGLYIGTWQSTPGKWRIDYDEWEYCHILSGVSVLTNAAGESVMLRAGDSFILEPGFAGSWEVIETTTKEYVIICHQALN